MFIKLFLISLPVFFIIDIAWIGLIARNFYKNQIGFLMSPNINWAAAITFYIIFILGLTLFVTMPAIEKDSIKHAALMGLAFGGVTYATYDMTNLATLKDWPLTMVFVDICWGAILAASISVATYAIYTKIF
jgi:uncharacterized membrane protein